MISFLHEYNDLFVFSKRLIEKYKFGYILPSDLVNEAYIRCFYCDSLNDKQRIKKIIYEIFYEEYRSVGLFSDKKMDELIKEQSCKGCQQSLPINSFTNKKTKSGYRYTETYCKNCSVKMRNQNRIKNKILLSDGYIIQLIRETNQFKLGNLIITPEIIEQKRKKVIAKRKKQ